MKVTIIQVGKTKNKNILELEKDYLEKLKPFYNVHIITVKEHIIPKGNEQAGQNIVKKKEAQEIMKRIPDKSFVVFLDEKGSQYDSFGFAEFINEKLIAPGHMTFISGGCYGLDEAVLLRGDLILSFSKFTFTHELIRVLLLEQIYRAATIQKGIKYHY